MMRSRNCFVAVCMFVGVCLVASPKDVPLVAVISKPLSRIIELPGEFLPFLSVAVHARTQGYVERVLVDRGSAVKEGQLLVELSAPELSARIAEAEFRVQSADADRLQTEAQLAGIRSTLERLRKAAETPGAIAGNEIVQVEKQVEATEALIVSRQQIKRVAEAFLQGQKDLAAYLRITAPFDGVVTERLVHPGALAGPGTDTALLIIQQLSRLRLVVAVPEQVATTVTPGTRAEFRVPAFPDRTFAGTVARSSHVFDPKTRTMAVELDVQNRDGLLSPGMYPTVKWPLRRAGQALLVPRTSVVTTTERTFVVRSRNGLAEWVDVQKGVADGDLLEVRGDLKAGDMVVRVATDELRNGVALGK